jgi:hypothetical protein
MPLIAYYLQEVCKHEQQTGEKLVDYLDIHYYPQAEGMIVEYSFADWLLGVFNPRQEYEDPTIAALRLRSVRSLFDPTYVDES